MTRIDKVGVVGAFIIMAIGCIMLSNRMDTISENVDGIFNDMYGVNKSLDSKIETNLDVANGDIGYLIDENIKLVAQVADLNNQLTTLAKVSQFQDQFIHDAMEKEMGVKDFNKFKERWARAKVQAKR